MAWRVTLAVLARGEVVFDGCESCIGEGVRPLQWIGRLEWERWRCGGAE